MKLSQFAFIVIFSFSNASSNEYSGNIFNQFSHFMRNKLLPHSSSQLSTQISPTIEVGFSPNGAALPLIIKVIRSAKKSICMAAYSFTLKNIAQELINAKERGVLVKVVTGKVLRDFRYNVFQYLRDNLVQVHVNTHYQIMHNKFIVVDDITVETGSFNYSKSAVKKNAENVIVLWNNQNVAHAYLSECERLFLEGTPY